MKCYSSRILLILLAVGPVGCDGDPDVPPENIPVPEVDSSATEEAAAASPAAAVPVSEVVVYKSPTCGCCANWVEHMREAGFEVETRDVEDARQLSALKAERGVPPQHQSCHTAVVDGYVVEGHVPADVVRRMLEERPEIAGLAVPGMPLGSPGMEVPSGERQAYDVIAFTGSGKSSVYASR